MWEDSKAYTSKQGMLQDWARLGRFFCVFELKKYIMTVVDRHGRGGRLTIAGSKSVADHTDEDTSKDCAGSCHHTCQAPSGDDQNSIPVLRKSIFHL